MNIWFIFVSLIYLFNFGDVYGHSHSHSHSYDKSEIVFGDSSNSLCPSAEYVLNACYQGAVAANIETPQAAMAYVQTFVDPGFRHFLADGNIDGIVQGFQGIVGHIWMEAKLLENKVASDPKNIRYGPNFVAVDYKLSVKNRCGDYVDNVKTSAVFYCNGAPDKISEVNLFRDLSKLQPFMMSSMVCAQQIGLAQSQQPAAKSPNGINGINFIQDDSNYYIQVSSSHIMIIGCVLGVILICNMVLLCKGNMGKTKKGKYRKVGYIDTDTDNAL